MGRFRSFDVAVENFDQVFCGSGFARVHLGIAAEHVEADFAIDDFDQQAVDGAATGGDLLEHVGTVAFFRNGAANTLELTLQAVDPGQQLLFLFAGVSHRRPSLTYYTQYSIKGAALPAIHNPRLK